MATDAIKGELLAIGILMLVLTIGNLEETKVELYLFEFSEIFKTFFDLLPFYFLSY